MQSPDEIAVGGDVVPFRHGSPPVELGPVSPELALVDPELGRAARERLPDPPPSVPAGRQEDVAPVAERPAAVERLPSRLEPTPVPARPRRRIRLWSARVRCGDHCARCAAHGRGRSRGLPARRAQQTQSVAARRLSAGETSPTKPNDAGDLRPGSCDRSSGENVRLARVPGRSGVRVPAVRGRRAHLPSTGGRSPARASRSLAAGRPSPRAAAGELPLVCVDDLQAHESPVDQADGERKTRGRAATAVTFAPRA